MKVSPGSLSLIAFLLLAAWGQTGHADQEVPFQRIRLQSGDMLHGRVTEIGSGELTFTPRWSLTSTRIPMRKINYVYFPGHAERDMFAPAWVRFTDGSRMGGRPLGMAEDGIRWETRWGQILTLNAAMVDEINVEPPEDNFYIRGTLPEEDWQVIGMRGSQQFPDGLVAGVSGELYITQMQNLTLNRELPEIPERFMMSFSLQAREESLSTSVSLLVPSAHSRGPGSLYLRVNNNHIFAQVQASNRQNSINWREETPADAGSRQDFQLFMDMLTGKSVLYMNGRKLQEWLTPDTRELIGERGRLFSLRFMQMGAGRRLSGFRMQRWDGETLPLQDGVLDRQRHNVLFLNGDTLSGNLISMTETHLRLALPDGESDEKEVQEIAWEDVSNLLFPVPARQTPRRRRQDGLVRTHGEREKLMGSVNRFQNGTVHLEGLLWREPLEIPHAEVALIRFNIHSDLIPEAEGLSIDLGESLLVPNQEGR